MFGLYRIPVYSGFGLDRFHGKNVRKINTQKKTKNKKKNTPRNTITKEYAFLEYI